MIRWFFERQVKGLLCLLNENDIKEYIKKLVRVRVRRGSKLFSQVNTDQLDILIDGVYDEMGKGIWIVFRNKYKRR